MPLYFSTEQHSWFHREKTIIPYSQVDDVILMSFCWPKSAIEEVNKLIKEGVNEKDAIAKVSVSIKEQNLPCH